MGNQHSSSRSTPASSQPQSPVGVGSSSQPSSHGHAHASHSHSHSQNHSQSHSHSHSHSQHPPQTYRTGRRESIQHTIQAARPAPPSASFAEASAVPGRPPSRGSVSSVANTAHVASQLRAAQDRSLVRDPSSDRMGNEQSSQKKEREREREKERERERPSRQHTPQPAPSSAPTNAPTTTSTSTTTSTPPSASNTTPPQAARPPPTAPIATATTTATPPPTDVHADAIPIDAPHSRNEQAIAGSLEPADASQDYLVPSSHFSRPPRLPLPIEEEVHTPGSPIISPTDLASPIDHGEVEGALPRRTSMLSSTTADDDDLGDEFKVPTPGRPTVPTLIEWEGAGDRVYVTGTFAGWNRKYRLHPNGPSKKPNVLSAHVPIHPGTHHLMFIVDNDMMISDKLPTAVDYTNILVNYLEVSYDDVNSQPVPATSDKPTDTPAPTQDPAAPQPPQDTPSPEATVIKPATADLPNTKLPEPEKRYHSKIPAYLLDLDAPEESSRFARANAAASNLPTPPSLPMFLSKSILNGTTPMKDDSSVLIMPNHTVLNHLATSSIKDNVLATSATTRYKQKFLTTIMYKPKEEAGDVY